MAKGVNKAIIVGHLGQDVELRNTANGAAIANLSVATKETWKGKDGQKQEATEWHRIVLFGKLAEIAGQYLKKGSLAYFEGRIQTRKWQDQQGNDRYSTEIVANQLQMLGGKSDHDNTDHRQSAQDYREQSQGEGKPPIDDGFDDIPF